MAILKTGTTLQAGTSLSARTASSAGSILKAGTSLKTGASFSIIASVVLTTALACGIGLPVSAVPAWADEARGTDAVADPAASFPLIDVVVPDDRPLADGEVPCEAAARPAYDYEGAVWDQVRAFYDDIAAGSAGDMRFHSVERFRAAAIEAFATEEDRALVTALADNPALQEAALVEGDDSLAAFACFRLIPLLADDWDAHTFTITVPDTADDAELSVELTARIDDARHATASAYAQAVQNDLWRLQYVFATLFPNGTGDAQTAGELLDALLPVYIVGPYDSTVVYEVSFAYRCPDDDGDGADEEYAGELTVTDAQYSRAVHRFADGGVTAWTWPTVE